MMLSKKIFLVMSILSATFSSSILAAPPGKPSIQWGEYTYALVDIDITATAYEKLIKELRNEVTVDVKWNVWSGDAAEIARILLDGNVVWQGVANTKQASFQITKGGTYKMVVELENANGVSRSDPQIVVVADTDGSHLQALEHSWSENNRPYKNTTGKIVGSYFVEWGIYGRKYPLDIVPLHNLNRIIYGFVPICGGDGINDSVKTISGSFDSLQRACAGRDDFKVAIHDLWAAIQIPQEGVKAQNNPYKGNFGQMMAAKKANPQLKILPSIGGWTLSDPFFFMHDDKKRKVFVESVREYLKTWKFFDGVDIDFEFPGGGGANPNLGNKARDGQIYIDIMKDLRAMLDELGAETGRYYELTSAINIGYDKLAVVDYGEASKYMDNIYLMSYDFYGAWDNNVLNHQTGLHRSSVNPSKSDYYTSRGVDLLIAQGVPAEKLVVGAAAFGRGWQGVSGYPAGNPFLGKATGPIKGTWENGVLDYRDIANNHGSAQGFEYGYDEQAEAPYLFKASTGELITYDDPRSTKAKAQYVQQKGLGGIFHWEMDGDNGDLVNAMHQGFGHPEGINKPGVNPTDPPTSNRSPIARAGADQTVIGPKTVTLNGSASSDPDGDRLSYQWSQISGNSLNISSNQTPVASVIVPSTYMDTSYSFKLVVTDPKGKSAFDTIVINNKAEERNKAPVVNIQPSTYVVEDANFSLTANATDADGDSLSFTWNVPNNFILLEENQNIIKLTAPSVGSDSQYTISVRVSDGEVSTLAKTVVNVKNVENSTGGNTGSGNSGCATTDPNAINYASWDPSKVYTSETVSHKGLVYKAKWWVQNVEPTPEADPWLLISDVELSWMAGVVYNGNQQVNHNGSRWQAKWWTKGDEPGVSSVWVNVGPAKCK